MTKHSERACPAFKTSVGGQALMEGVMMRGPEKIACAVRKPDGTIYTEARGLTRHAWQKIPVVRGVGSFVDSLVTGYRYLMKSAEVSMTESQREEEQSAFDRWVDAHLGEKGANAVMALAAVLGGALAVALFVVLPTFLVGLLDKAVALGGFKTLPEGVLKIALLVAYMAAVSTMPDIARMFRYHGAEHKTIACYEAGEELTVENIRRHSRFHPRCGTSFLVLVILISILVSSLLPWSSTGLRIVLKLLTLPVVMGISYELIKLAGRYDNILTRIISAPGLWIQRLTTSEPDDNMIEVAIAAVKPVLPENWEDSLW